MQKPNDTQRGSTLLVSLMFLMVMTLVATGVWRMAMQQESMTGFERDYQVAFEAAEQALRDAELDYFNACMKKADGTEETCTARSVPIAGITGFGKVGAPNDGAGTCSTTGLCRPNAKVTPAFKIFESQPKYKVLSESSSGAAEKPVVIGTFTRDASKQGSVVPNVIRQPQYLIEAMQMGGNNGRQLAVVYRITAIGFGRRNDTRVVLQSFLDPN
jgi:type IV pilus assembly protein PilX